MISNEFGNKKYFNYLIIVEKEACRNDGMMICDIEISRFPSFVLSVIPQFSASI